MARNLVEIAPDPERDHALIFEEPGFLTFGICYEGRACFPGSVYQSVLRRIESFLAAKLPDALAVREQRAARLFELEDAVLAAVAELKGRGK